VYLDHATRTGSIELYNPGTTPVEVTIGTQFGYPVSDSTGASTLRLFDTVPDTAPSAADWVMAFPRRVTVGPQARQTVRLLGRPPAGLPDGEYWTRIIVAAKGGQVPVTGVDTARIQVGLSLEIHTIISLAYRKGAVATGIDLSAVEAHMVGDSLMLSARLHRRGNAAFVGVLRATVLDSTDATLMRMDLPLAVYYDMSPHYVIPIRGSASQARRVVVEMNTERDDIDRSLLLPITPVADTVEVARR